MTDELRVPSWRVRLAELPEGFFCDGWRGLHECGRKPMYPQADFPVRRWAAQVKADPAKAREQPVKAVAEGDRAWLAAALSPKQMTAAGRS
jgi:hypothetical protein